MYKCTYFFELHIVNCKTKAFIWHFCVFTNSAFSWYNTLVWKHIWPYHWDLSLSFQCSSLSLFKVVAASLCHTTTKFKMTQAIKNVSWKWKVWINWKSKLISKRSQFVKRNLAIRVFVKVWKPFEFPYAKFNASLSSYLNHHARRGFKKWQIFLTNGQNSPI